MLSHPQRGPNSGSMIAGQQRRLVMCQTVLWVNIVVCFSLHDLSCCSDLCRGDRRSIKIKISFFFSMSMLFRLPYQYMMILEDLKNVRVFAIESQSEDESTRDRSVLHTQMVICSYFLYISCHFLTFIDM